MARAAVKQRRRPLAYAVVGFNDLAVRAAASLEVIRKRDPERFSTAVEEFLSVLPGHPDAASALASDYLGSANVGDLPEWPSALLVVQARRNSLSRSLPPPFADVDGVRLSRDDDAPFGEVGFDPFADKSLFSLAIQLIRNCGGPHVK